MSRAPNILDRSCGDGTNMRDYFSPPGGPVQALFDDASSGPKTHLEGSFLDDAHPGPAPHNPEVVGDDTDQTPEDHFASAVITSARDLRPESASLEDVLLLRETKGLSGAVSNLEVCAGGGHFLSLGSGMMSAFRAMLRVTECAVHLVDRDHEERAETIYLRARGVAQEHVREIRAALRLPKFEVGQVWRLVDTREITISGVLNGRVTARVSAGGEDDEEDYSSGWPLEYDLDGVNLDQSISLQPHMIFHRTPIALLAVVASDDGDDAGYVRVPDYGYDRAAQAQRTPEEKWPDDRTVAVGVDEQTQQVVVVPVRPANPWLAKTSENLASAAKPRKPKKTKTKE